MASRVRATARRFTTVGDHGERWAALSLGLLGGPSSLGDPRSLPFRLCWHLLLLIFSETLLVNCLCAPEGGTPEVEKKGGKKKRERRGGNVNSQTLVS